MKSFTSAKMVMFDSTIACFKLSVESLFTRKRADNSLASLVYTTDRGVANLDPNVYLVFTYKGDSFENTKNLYTSYPQLFPLRKAVEKIKGYVIDNKGFGEVEGVLTVRPDHQDPVVVSEVGKSKKWISFSLTTIDSQAEGTGPKIPGVIIQLSDSEFASVLTVEEFLTVYSIISDLNLPSIQLQFANMFLQADGAVQQPMYQQPAYGQPQYQQQPQQPYQQPYQQQGRSGGQSKYGQKNYQQRPQPETRVREAVAPTTVENTNSGSGNLPPRKEKNIVNLQNVEDVPVSSVKFDDKSAIDNIFGDDDI
jgi:hypothetical protein